MDYNLALQLKEAGFPQGEHTELSIPRLQIEEVKDSYVKLPTLEEVIEELGELETLLKADNPPFASEHWIAVSKKNERALGETPLLAVCNLYIAINSK